MDGDLNPSRLEFPLASSGQRQLRLQMRVFKGRSIGMMMFTTRSNTQSLAVTSLLVISITGPFAMLSGTLSLWILHQKGSTTTLMRRLGSVEMRHRELHLSVSMESFILPKPGSTRTRRSSLYLSHKMTQKRTSPEWLPVYQ